jgi:hypothetical protein
MDYTKGEVSELELRLIASATDSRPLIAGKDVCDKQTLSAREGDEPEQLSQNFTFGEIHPRFFPVSDHSFIYYALNGGRPAGLLPRSHVEPRVNEVPSVDSVHPL